VLIERARAEGGGELGIGLTNEACAFIAATVVRDLQLLPKFPEISNLTFPGFFDEPDPRKLEIPSVNFYKLVERLFDIIDDADTYFYLLALLQKSRLKFARILEYQPIPTMDQVGPRALLQFGQMSPRALACFLLWRKWLFDIDNRSGQETGYLFEPIIANAMGGASFSAKSSPIKRHTDKSRGRQVDCIRQKSAYEIKIRVTIAASGQGRWQEELDFPVDCKESGFKPVLIVLDSTPNPKLSELVSAFENAGGETYVGEVAWHHLEGAAGPVMSVFIDKYVKAPMQRVLDSTPDHLPDITLKMSEAAFSLLVDDEVIAFKRASNTPV
jgi:hypothetical protein